MYIDAQLAHSPHQVGLEMNSKRPRRLDLNAPLLSTRRSTTASIEIPRRDSLRNSCDRVPFSWEQSPGKPKDSVTRENVTRDEAFPLPKPPPIRWQEEPTLTYADSHVDGGELNDNEDEYADPSQGNIHHHHDNNDEDVASEDDGFSEAIDLFSLAESPWDDLDLGDDNNYYRSSSPNFMMQRFLPAATAIAASSLSALAVGEDLSTANNNYCKERSSTCVPRVGYSLTKGCGLEVFFPWRAKDRICGVKSPVRRVHSSFKKHQFSPTKK